jgi:hypothetical protein
MALHTRRRGHFVIYVALPIQLAGPGWLSMWRGSLPALAPWGP